MSRAFDLLSPALQYQIVNALGFADLRAVQEQAIEAILEGKNCVLLAPTAGGKTEAAFFPLLSQMDTQDWPPVSVIYISPIRALINNQEPRLERYAGLVGRRVFKWHGDVGPSKRKAFLNNPADILLTTPESLEVMLMSRKVPARELFRHLQAVVIDEIHAFAGDDRGSHLAAVLERLSRFCGRDVQRIGLSATVGNPEEIADWASGSSKREQAVVQPGGATKEPKLSLDYVGTLENAAKVIAQLHPGKKRLVFADSRRRVEALGRELRALGVDTHVTHSSLSRAERLAAEQAFAQGRDCVIVATSALELGIDIGDLDHVLQIDAPRTVAAFLQRMGRTGRREATTPNCTILCTDEWQLVQAAAIIRLYQKGYVEPIRLNTWAIHLLAHQIMALAIQEEGIPVTDWWAWISSAKPFQDITDEDRAELVNHMLTQDILHESAGRFHLGERGEKLYGFRNFSELYAVFETPLQFTVLHGVTEIGYIDAYFVETTEPAKLRFTLGAQSWASKHVDWTNGVIHAEPIPDPRDARWQGRPNLLGYDLCQSMRQVLTSADIDFFFSSRASVQLKKIREEHDFLDPEGIDLVEDADGYRLWTFAGGKANNVLSKTFESELGERVTSSNFSIGFRDGAAKSEVSIRHAITTFKQTNRPNKTDSLNFASGYVRGRLSKFQSCLSDKQRNIFLSFSLSNSRQARSVIDNISS